MGIEQIAYSATAVVGKRPWLAAALFRFEKFGNPFADERFSWPYPMYERMRAVDGNVVWSNTYQQWFVFGYEESQEVLSSSTSSAALGELLLSIRQYRKLSPAARANFSDWLLINDAPDHTRLRSTVSRAFTPRQTAGYQSSVAEVVDELLAELPSSGTFDIARAFNDKLPIHVIAELVGLPADKRQWLQSAAREIGGLLDPMVAFDPDSMSARFAELDTYFTELLAARRADPGTDLISALTDSDDVTDREIIALVSMLLFGGFETVSSMLGNALFDLANNPDQRALLREQPDLIENAIEELLRYDTAAQLTGRSATADINLGEHTIRKGQNIALMLAAANRDTRHWADADQLRLDRENPRSLAFGHGAHFCVGASLARMELRTAIPRLLDHLGDYTIDASRIEWKRSFALRGPTRLPVTLTQKSGTAT